MTFEEWIKTQDKCHPADWSSLSGAYRFWIDIARKAWDAGYQAGGSAEVEWQAYLDRVDD